MKRLFDIFFSSIGFVILLPFFSIVAIFIKMESKGPVFFIQERIGKDLEPFSLFKFRTMTADADRKGPLVTASGDSRVTRTGKFLRKTKIDELPQLWNVIKGDMSLVGPRPEVETYVNKFKKDYSEILKIRPGITDIASLTYRDEESVLKDKSNHEEYYIQALLPVKIGLAREYLKKASLIYDFCLIVRTLCKLIYPRRCPSSRQLS